MKTTKWNETKMRNMVAPTPKNVGELDTFIKSLVDGKHDYGTCVYAMSLAATAGFNFVASKLGVTGFQASCADLDILRRTRHLDGPFMLLKGEDALYPQRDITENVTEALDKWKPWLREQARKKIKEGGIVHPNVLLHWLKLAELPNKEAAFIREKVNFLSCKFTEEFVEKNASDFKRFGLDNIYLSDSGDISKADKCKVGGTWRVSMPVSLHFERKINGIRAYWSEDTEIPGSSGTPKLQFDWNKLDKLQKSATKPSIKKVLKKYIEDCKKAETQEQKKDL